MKFTPRSLLFFASVFIFLVVLLSYLALFVPEASEFSLRLLFNGYTITIGFFLVVATVAFLRFQLRVNNRSEVEKVESFVEGAYKEKLIQRELEGWEKIVLETKYKETQNNNFDLDRRSPVFKIQGKLLRMPAVNNEAASLGELWSVRGLTISEENYPDIRYKSFEEFPEVVVEFSPFSKYVWDIYGIVGDKKVWSMYLDEQSFDFLDKKQSKIIIRAPFGSHDLNKLRSGEIIRFIGLGMGRYVFVKVDFVHHYKTIDDLLISEKFTEILPTAKSVEEVRRFIHSLHDYEMRIAKGGVYAIGIEYIKFRY